MEGVYCCTNLSKKEVKVTVIVIVVYNCYELHKHITQYPSVKLMSILRKMIRNHLRDFRHNRSIIDQNFCIHKILEKEWEYNKKVHKLIHRFQEILRSS
jgi:hypothetical protein